MIENIKSFFVWNINVTVTWKDSDSDNYGTETWNDCGKDTFACNDCEHINVTLA